MNFGFLKWLLLPAAGCYCLITSVRNFFYDRGIFKTVNFSVPVIAVGNITAGGTGKTPFVIAMGDFLLKKGWRVAIVTRGYKKQSKGQIVVSDGRQILAVPSQAGDEPYLIAQRLPQVVVIADANRVSAAQTAIQKCNCNLVIADDAFQHRRLGRSLNIVLWNSQAQPEKEYLLPIGRLRESWRGMRRADYLIFSKATGVDAERKQFFRKFNPRLEFGVAPLVITGLSDLSGNQFPTDSVGGKNVLVFCGLGDNRQFVTTVSQLKPAKEIFRGFPDHHKYSAADLRQLSEMAKHFGCDYLITSAKDAVNLPDAKTSRILVLSIELQLDEKLKAAALPERPLTKTSPD